MSVFGYWRYRGLGSSIRYMLLYTGEPYTERTYMNKEEWFENKFKLGLDFPNVPYFISGDVKLTQSAAILRHIARKHGLVAATEEEAQTLDLLENQIADVRQDFIDFAHDPNWESLKEDYLKRLPAKLKSISEFLGEKPWLVGDRITYVDFMAYDTLDFHTVLKKDCLDDFPNLKSYLLRFEALPAIKKYMTSGTFKRTPIFGPRAYFCGMRK